MLLKTNAGAIFSTAKGQYISKKNMVSSILQKNERWDNFQSIKSSQRSFFEKESRTQYFIFEIY